MRNKELDEIIPFLRPHKKTGFSKVDLTKIEIAASLLGIEGKPVGDLWNLFIDRLDRYDPNWRGRPAPPVGGYPQSQ